MSRAEGEATGDAGSPADAGPGTEDGSTASLAGLLKRGAAASAVALVLVQGISLIQTLVLARMLGPVQIGLFAAGTVMANFLSNISEGGLGGAVVQRQDDVERAAETAFWANAVVGVVMATATLAGAPLIADFFRSPEAGTIAAVTAGTLFLHALTHVPDALMQRRFNFKRRLVLDPSVAVSFAGVSIVLAALGYGVWSMVVASYVSQIVWVASTFLLSGWRPGRHRPSVELWRQLARFAFPLALEGFAERLREVVETAVTGRAMNERALGNYRYGQRLSRLPGIAIVQIGSYVLFPAFSRMAGDVPRLRRAYLRALGWIWFAAVPVAALAVVFGVPVVVLLLGERWRDAGLVFVAMSGYGLGVALQAVAGEALKGVGRTRVLNWVTAVDVVLGIGLVLLLLPLGLIGVGLAVSVTAMSSGALSLVLAGRNLSIPVADVMRVLTPPVLAAAVPAIAIVAVVHVTGLVLPSGALAAALVLTGGVLLFALLYLVGIGLCAPARLRGLLDGVRSRIGRVPR